MNMGPNRLPPLLFLAAVLVAIVALLAGYGVPVGVGAMAGFALGAIAGIVGVLWLARGPGHSVDLGGMSWSSYDTAAGPGTEVSDQFREAMELLGVDLGPIESIVPVLSTTEADGIEVQLLSVELHVGGASIGVEAQNRPGQVAPAAMLNASISDDVGTSYRAFGQAQNGGPSRMRYEITVIPSIPTAARRLSVHVDGFIDPFTPPHQPGAGPWVFEVSLPEHAS